MKLIIQPSVKKQLKKLPLADAAVILKKLYTIRDDPLHHLERLKGQRLWKLRIGDYRAIVYIKTDVQEVHVVMVGHRSIVYKRLR